MTGGRIYPVSSFEEAHEALSELLSRDQERKRADFAKLEGLVARTWPDEPPSEPVTTARPSPPASAPPEEAPPDERPWIVPMTRRKTHGGDFGPAVKEKLMREQRRPGW